MNQAIVRKSNFEVELDNYEGQIAAALPAHISVEKFKRVLMTAIARDPALYMEADRRTLFNSAIQCATDGLVPDGREAALIIFNTKDRKTQQWVKAVQYIPMVHGIRKKMRNTGEVASAEAHCVFQNDAFDYALGDESYITHKPTLGDRGAMIGAYAIIKLTNGEVLREVMSRAEIEKVRAVSKSKDSGPWVSWFEEQARKTVLKRCSKAAPMSSDLERLMGRGDEPEPVPAVAPPRPTRRSIAAPIESEPEESQVDPAAAGHEDLDERFRQTTAETVDDQGEIHDTLGMPPSSPVTVHSSSAPSESSPKPGAAHHPAEATQAPAQAEGAQVAAREKGQKEGLAATEPGGVTPGSEPYDAAREYDALWAGAMAETTKGGRTQYWAMQREEGAAGFVLYEKAPDLYKELAGKIMKSIKEMTA